MIRCCDDKKNTKRESQNTKQNIMETKKKYIKPRIEWIPLDNEISLALESSPPAGPSETLNSVQSPFKKDTGLV
jgi:hypothetical protein